VSAFDSLVLAMVLFPDVQCQAHDELDRVVGRDRLPEFTDRAQLPFIDATIKEVLRWSNTLPNALPHSNAEADIYRGYYIPKDATVIANSWAMLHDPQMYPEPETFNPSRFLDPNGKLDPNVRDPETAFGFGRRLCPGRFMAMDSMFITTACLLATFQLRKAVGPDGKQIPLPKELFASGMVTHPNPFTCSIRPRSEASVALIRSASDFDPTV